MFSFEEISFVAPPTPNKKALMAWKALILIGELIEKERGCWREHLIGNEEFREICERFLKKAKKRPYSKEDVLEGCYRFHDEKMLKDFLILLKRDDFFPFFRKEIPFTARSVICWSSFKLAGENKIGLINNIQRFLMLIGIPIEDLQKEGKKLLDYVKKEDYLKIVNVDDNESICMTPKAYKEILGYELKEPIKDYELFDSSKNILDFPFSFLNKNKEDTISSSFIPSVKVYDLVLEQEILKKIKFYVTLVKKDPDENFKLLFYGPPGTGKTYTAQAIAGELQRSLINLDISKVLDKYFGETEKVLSRTFEQAKRNKSIILIDEGDAFLKKRNYENECHHVMVSHLLKLLENDSCSVIICTNFFDALDEALLRRIDEIIEFKIPKKEERKGIWIKEFEKSGIDYSSIDMEKLSQIVLSGGLIKNCVRKFKRYLILNEENQNPTFEIIYSFAMEELKKMNPQEKIENEVKTKVIFLERGGEDGEFN